MAYSPPHYAPSSYVKTAHDFYRPLEHSYTDLTDIAYWGLEGDQRAEHYMTAVSSLGLFAAGIGLLLVIIYWISLCCGCCKARTAKDSGRNLFCSSTLWLLLCFLCTGGIALGGIWGERKLSNGVDSVLDSMDSAEQLFQDVQGDTTRFLNQTKHCSSLAHVLYQNCDVDVDKVISKFQTELTSTSQQVQDALDRATSVNDQVVEWRHKISEVDGISISNLIKYFGWASAALVALSCIFGVLGCICRSHCLLSTSAGLGISMLFVVIILVGAELGLTVFVSDLCTTEPLAQAAEIVDVVALRPDVDTDALVLSSASYYLTCNSSKSNPLAESLQQADEALQEVLAAASILELMVASHCTGPLPTKTVTQLEVVLRDMNRTLAKADSSTACSEVNPILVQAVNQATCSDVFDGVFVFWVTQAVAGFCLLVTQWFSFYVRSGWRLEEATRAVVYMVADDSRYVPMLGEVKEERDEHRLDL